MRLLEVNLLKADYFLASLRRRKEHSRARIFFVSTDKAANPIGLMGASKRAMELLLWAHSQCDHKIHEPLSGDQQPLTHVTTARFANVAFSDGSLPWSFLQRLEKDQPLAAPGDIHRYLVTPAEAGQLCLLAGAATPHARVVIPRLDPEKDMASFVDIAIATLREFKLTPTPFSDPVAALAAVAEERARGHYPVLVTTSDTSGEKEVEEFIAHGEQAMAHSQGFTRLATIAAPARVDVSALKQLLRVISQAVHARDEKDVLGKPAIAQALAAVVPGFVHRDTGKSLDGKM
jgi:FlaA1/EpsC-like NDP-sugar epimerase